MREVELIDWISLVFINLTKPVAALSRIGVLERIGERASNAVLVIHLEWHHPFIVCGDVVVQSQPQLPQVARARHATG